MSPAAAEQRLHLLVIEASRVGQFDADHPDFVKWKRNCEAFIERRYGLDSNVLIDFRSIDFTGDSVMFAGSAPAAHSPSPSSTLFTRAMQRAEGLLQSMSDEARTDAQEEQLGSSQSRNSDIPSKATPPTNKVFVVHGHDDGTKEHVARFLTKLGLEPVILHEFPNSGRTIIEKFEDYSDAAFAVVLLTPDDVGGVANDPSVLKARARQNVIFEFGYFIGRLGRGKVCGLYRGDVELPSDYSGVLYVEFDTKGAWQMQLVRELRAGGLSVDANKAI